MNVRPMHTKRLAASLCAAGLMLAAGAAQAADLIGRAGIQAQYEQDVAACKNGSTGQERTACMREAGAARQEANRQRLSDGTTEQHQQNMLDRCNRLPADSRQDCWPLPTACCCTARAWRASAPACSTSRSTWWPRSCC